MATNIQYTIKQILQEWYQRGSIPDISEIGEFVFDWEFDEDEYAEYLEDNEMEDSPESKKQFAMEYGEFNIEFLDSETYHHINNTTLSYDEIVDNFDEFGEPLANYIVDTCLADGQGRIEKSCIMSYDNFNVNNPDELNALAVKLLPSGGYFNGCRGFILTNGTIVYTPIEHNQSSVIPGINGTFDFIKHGNIRVTLDGLDICKPPTQEQMRTIANIVRYFKDKTLYVTFVNTTGGEHYKTFNYPNAEIVISTINDVFGIDDETF